MPSLNLYVRKTAAIVGAAFMMTSMTFAFLDSPIAAHREGVEGCTPGFWKNHISEWDDGLDIRAGGQDKTITPDSLVSDVFDVTFANAYTSFNDLTLQQALELQGGVNALLRQGVAALLNSGEKDGQFVIDFSLDDDQVYDRVRDALDGLNPQVIEDIAEFADDSDLEQKKKNVLEQANANIGGKDH